MYYLSGLSQAPPPAKKSKLQSWADIVGSTNMILGAVISIYQKLFSCTDPDSISLDFDPEGRPGGRLYDKGSAETNRLIIEEFQKPIWTGYGITQTDVHNHVWNPIFQFFETHGKGWNIDVNAWIQISVDFFNWLVSQGKTPDPGQYFSAHENFKVAMKTSCGSGRLKRKDFIPFSKIREQLLEQVGGSVQTQGAGIDLGSLFQNKYVMIGGTFLVLFLLFNAFGGSSQPQYVYLPKGRK